MGEEKQIQGDQGEQRARTQVCKTHHMHTSERCKFMPKKQDADLANKKLMPPSWLWREEENITINIITPWAKEHPHYEHQSSPAGGPGDSSWQFLPLRLKALASGAKVAL